MTVRPEIDYRALHQATQDALYALERGVLVDFWPAYERMHEAAAMGPMPWAAPLSRASFACSDNPATLTTGSLNLKKLDGIVRGIARNVEADDRFSAWLFADGAVRGARRMTVFNVRNVLADLTAKLGRLKDDQSPDGLQASADYAAEWHRAARELQGEVLICGMSDLQGVA